MLVFILAFSDIYPALALSNKDDVSVFLSMDDISARSAVLINAQTNEIYFEKNANERLGMASTTKLMTALTALKLLSPDMIVSIPKEAIGIEGSSIYLIEGECLSVSELLYALLLSSANDAAVALAVAASGSVDAFVCQMNEQAQAWGLTDTSFVNPHGLHDKEHYTTAYELARIGAKALENEIIREIVCQKRATIPHNGEADKRLLVNHNKLLSSYDGTIGMKTGFTKSTGRTLVSAATRDDLTLIAVTLDAPSDWNDHKLMLDYGFNNYERVCLFPAGTFTQAVPISDADSDLVTLTNEEPIWITRKKGDGIAKITLCAPWRFALGSVQKGDRFGSVTIECQSGYGSSPLVYAEDTIGRTKSKKGFFERIIGFFSTE